MPKLPRSLYLCGLSACSEALLAAESAPTSAGVGMFKVILGLLVVLAVMAGFAWAMKRFGLNHVYQNSVARIVGGVSLGNRERVVVLEVSGRWLVIGVTQHQISAIANLEPASVYSKPEHDTHGQTNSFSQWLQSALKK